MNRPKRSRVNHFVSAAVVRRSSRVTTPPCLLSASETRHGYSPDEPALGEQIDDNGRDGGDGGGCHKQVPLGPVLALEVPQANDNRDRRVGVRDYQRPQQVVPVEQESEDGERSECRPREWKDDAPEATEAARTVDAGGVLQLVRDGEEELPQQEDTERRERLGDYEALVSIHPVEFLYEDELRYDRDLGRDHERTQVQEEEQIAPPEPQAGEGVGSKGRGHRLEDGDTPDHDQAVYQVSAEWGEVPGRREVLGMPLPRPPGGRVGRDLRG